MTRQIPWLRVFVEGVVIVVSILLAFGLQATVAEAQVRSDSLAVIAASLERFGGGFLADDAPELVLAAARLLPPGLVRPAGDRLTLCSSNAEMALDGDNVGGRVSVSLTPGPGPLRRIPQPADSAALRPAPTQPRDFTHEVAVLSPSFYIDEEIAYVSVSGGCWMGEGGGGGVQTTLDDGRRVTAFSHGVVFELQREGTRWVVTGTVRNWMT